MAGIETAGHNDRSILKIEILPPRYFIHSMIFLIVALVTLSGGWKHTKSIEALVAERTFAPQSLNEGFLSKPLGPSISSNTIADGVPVEGPAAPAISATSTETKPRTEVVVHTVKAGDTVSDLATAYSVSVDTIRWANKLDDVNSLSIGQQLQVLPVSGVLYSVAAGDTLSDIATKFKADSAAIIDYNKMANPDKLVKDAKLIIPGGKIEEAARPQPVARSERPQTAAPVQAQAPAAQSAPNPPPAVSGAQVDVVNFALGFLGSPYAWGGTSPRGFDCSGFVNYVYNQKGISMPRDLWGQVQASKPVAREALQPGDIVFFANTYGSGLSHDGIYIGGGKFIHAESEWKGVTITELNSAYWAARYYGGRRP